MLAVASQGRRPPPLRQELPPPLDQLPAPGSQERQCLKLHVGWQADHNVMCLCRWSLIAGRLPGRTDNEIKNYWNTHIRRKLVSRGIDPTTHRPINEPAAAVAGAPPQEASKTISFSKTDRIEKCPDLNLDLRISPPSSSQQQNQERLKTGTSSGSSTSSTLCFACSLGIQNSKDCSCRDGIMNISGSGSSSGYDFLGLKAGVLDYRSLEMK